jgi:tetratricopeptide (TPR) repeat protein
MGEILMEKGELKEAEKIFRQVVAMEDRYYPSHFHLAMVLERQQQYQEAIAEYKRAIELKPTEAAPYHNIGSILTSIGNNEDAERFFIQALKVDPGQYVTRIKLAELYWNGKNIDKAAEQLKLASEIDSANPTAFFYFGKISAGMNNGEKAIAAFQKALERSPNNADIHYEMAKVYLVLLKDTAKAAYHFKRTLELNPNHPDKVKIQKTIDKFPSNP